MLTCFVPGSNSLSLNIEITGYAVLTLVRLGGDDNMVNALRAVRWITQQRNSQGGFVSTQVQCGVILIFR